MFGIRPCGRPQLLLAGVEAFDDPFDAKSVVLSGAVERPDDAVDNGEVEEGTVGMLVAFRLLLL